MRHIVKSVAVSALAAAMVATAGCASQATRIALQRPDLPTGQAFLIPEHHALRNAVTVDYISGMSQHSFWFAEANQNRFRPILQEALTRSGLAAPTPAAARYGLQIEFVDLQGSFFGADFDSRSRAVYRIVERRTGRTVFERVVDAGFMARYVGLVEEDAVAAYWLTRTVGAVGVAHGLVEDNSRAWRQAYQATLWSTLFVPLAFIWPGNYIAPGDFFGNTAAPRARVLNGDLSTEGYGARDGFTRGIQADTQMMRQSIAKFFIAFSEDHRIPMTVVLPCAFNKEVEDIKVELTMRGIPYRGDNCDMRPVQVIY